MKISPLEIRQKTFEKNFRGYDKDEVDAFLLSLSQEWERVMDDSKELKLRLQQSEKEVQKLREVESTLYKTLKTAEDTGANIVEQANRSAVLLTKEAQMNAESMLNDARNKSKNLVEEADEKSKNMLFHAQNKLSEIAIEIKSLDNQKLDLVRGLRQLAEDLVEKANRIAAPTILPDFSKLYQREDNTSVTSYSWPTITAPIAETKKEEAMLPSPLPSETSVTALPEAIAEPQPEAEPIIRHELNVPAEEDEDYYADELEAEEEIAEPDYTFLPEEVPVESKPTVTPERKQSTLSFFDQLS